MNTVAAINPTGAEIHSPETMPHSIEAEQQLLGAILSNNDVFDRADSLISSEHFFDPVVPWSSRVCRTSHVNGG